MKTTIELPDTLYRRVKSKSSLDGQSVRAVTQRLYEQWLDGRVSLDEPEQTSAKKKDAWAAKWVRETNELAEKIGRTAVDKRSCRDILQAERR
jgi:hypothetical protein